MNQSPLPAVLMMELDAEREQEMITQCGIGPEIAAGIREVLPCGRITINCEINDQAKYEAVQQYLLHYIAQVEQTVNPN